MKEISLAHNKGVVLVDDEDYEMLSSWPWAKLSGHATDYATANISMHRLLMGAKPGEIIDHINGNGLDNQRSNLRRCTAAQNQANRKQKRTGTTSKYRGVFWTKRDQKWIARIRANGVRYNIGSFTSELEAAEAYQQELRKHFGEFVKEAEHEL
jgi:hypothetical protein